MEFERNELKIIKFALEERDRRISKNIEELKLATWENIGGMQNMYANKQAFEDFKNNNIKEKEEEIEIINDILEKIYEEI